MTLFISGALMMASFAAAMFFIRYWRRTHDRLFLLFATAFAILGVNRLFLALLAHGNAHVSEHQMLLYLARLLAFVIILVAIIDKNRATRPARQPPAVPPTAPSGGHAAIAPPSATKLK